MEEMKAFDKRADEIEGSIAAIEQKLTKADNN